MVAKQVISNVVNTSSYASTSTHVMATSILLKNIAISIALSSPWDNMHQPKKFQQNCAVHSWVVDVSANFPGFFQGPN